MKYLKTDIILLASILLGLSLMVMAGEPAANAYVYNGSPSIHRAPSVQYTSSPAVHAAVKRANTNPVLAVHRAVHRDTKVVKRLGIEALASR